MSGLVLALLGPIQAHLDGRRLTGFPTHKALGLLVYLAVERGQAHRRETLAGLFWPDQPDDQARSNLRQTLVRVRKVLGDETSPAEAGQAEAGAAPRAPLLRVDAQTVEFDPASALTLDLAEFNALLDQCQRHPHRRLETCLDCALRLERASSLYRGDFLAGFFLKDCVEFEEWALVQRERLRRRAQTALDGLAAHYERFEDYARAQQAAERLLELDPWREEAHQRRMRLLALAGSRSAALAQFEACRRVLAQELGVEPSAATQSLHARIRAGLPLEAGPEAEERQRRRRTLPEPPTPLVGREAELAQLGDWLADPARRLITLLGLGGAGKTRLALAAAHAHAAAVNHGAAFVPLVEAAQPNQAEQPGLAAPGDLLATAILGALGAPLHGTASPEDELLAYLRPREMLLVLDSFEHVASPASTALVARLLQQARGVTLLVTSRERLAVRAEWVLELGGLSYPAGGAAASQTLAAPAGAVLLFVENARRLGRQLDAAEAEAVAHICQLVDGLPLGIELAVASLHGRPVTALAAELAQGQARLSASGDLRDLPERHRSLQAAIEYSWQRLPPAEQQAFRQLAVFRGGFEAEAAASVARAPADVLGSLGGKSLLRIGVGRFDLHDLLRQFAAEKLAAAGEAAAARQRHLAYYTRWMEAAEPRLNGSEQATWLARVERESDNLRAALAWAIAAAGTEDPAPTVGPDEEALGLRLAGSLGYFWYVRGHLGEGRRWLEAVLAEAARPGAPVSNPARSKALDGLGVLAWRQGDHARAEAALSQALALRRAAGDEPGQAQVLAHQGLLRYAQSDLAGAEAAYTESLALSRRLGDREGIVRALHNLGNLAMSQHARELAERYYNECLDYYRELGGQAGLALVSLGLGELARHRGDFARARAMAEQAQALAGQLRDPWTAAAAANSLGLLALQQGDLEAADRWLRESLATAEELGDAGGTAGNQCLLARVVRARGEIDEAVALLRESLRASHAHGFGAELADALVQLAALAAPAEPRRAIRLLAAAATQRAAIQAPVDPAFQPEHEALLASLRASLGQAALDQLWAEGGQLARDDAVREALGEVGA